MPTIPEALEHLPLLRHLSPTQRDRVNATAHERRLDRGEILFHEGDPANAMYAVIEGQVKLVRYSPDGKELLLHLVHPAQSFAEAALFGETSYPATALALVYCRLWTLPRTGLLELIQTSPDLGLAMLASVSQWTRRLAQRLDLLTQRRVEERLALYLIARLSGQTLTPGLEIRLSDPRNLIAAQIGTAPEVLSRTLRRLEDSQILRITAAGVVVADPQRLRDLASWIEEDPAGYPPSDASR